MSGKDILTKISQGMGGMTPTEIEEAIRRLSSQLSGMDSSPPVEILEDVTQQQPLQGQTRNTHGGFSFEIDNVTRLKRYLILGSARPEYNSTQAVNISNTVPVVNDMIRSGDGRTVIDTILGLNKDARISREEHFLVVLRDCIMYQGEAWYDEENKITIQRKAFDSISSICNIPTKLFRLIELCSPSSWGRARKRGISSFYTDETKDANRLLLLVTKYKSCHNWNHKQVIGYCHPKMKGNEAVAKSIVMKYATRGFDGVKKYYDKKKTQDVASSSVLKHIKVLEEVKILQPEKPDDVTRLLELMKDFVKREVPLEFSSDSTVEISKPTENLKKKKCSFHLVHQHLPSGFLKLKDVSLNLYPL